jgi:hypothetical protein
MKKNKNEYYPKAKVCLLNDGRYNQIPAKGNIKTVYDVVFDVGDKLIEISISKFEYDQLSIGDCGELEINNKEIIRFSKKISATKP